MDDWEQLLEPPTVETSDQGGFEGTALSEPLQAALERVVAEAMEDSMEQQPVEVSSTASSDSVGDLEETTPVHHHSHCDSGAPSVMLCRGYWATHAVSVLHDHFSQWPQRLTLKYAGDCSGAEAGFEACRDIATALEAQLHMELHLSHEYASEHPGADGEAPRKWLEANSTVLRMYRDMRTRVGGVQHGGPCDWVRSPTGTVTHPEPGTRIPPPEPGTVDLYVGGFVCKDNSSANRHRRRDSAHSGAGSRDTSGQSYNTYVSSKQAIMQESPRRFILENVGHCPVEPTVEDLRSALPHYFIKCFKTEATHFHAATRRLRIFIVGVLRVVATVPPTEWDALLTDLGSEFSGSCARCGTARYRVTSAEDQYARTVFANLQCSIPESSATAKWMTEHDTVRSHLPQPPALPTLEELQAQCTVTGLTTQRELDLRNLLHHSVSLRFGDPAALDLYWDVSAEASHRNFQCQLGSGWVPCFLSSHKIYSTRLGRCLTGKEHMLLQCFSPDLDYTCVSDSDLRRLAGLSMHVAQVGAVVALTLAVGMPLGNAPAKIHQACAVAGQDMPLSRLIRASTVEPVTHPLPGLDTRKRKLCASASDKAECANASEIQWHMLPRAEIQPADSPPPDGGLLTRACVNAVDLTAFACDGLPDPHSWAQQVADAVSQIGEPVVLLGLSEGQLAAAPSTAPTVPVYGASTFVYAAQCQTLMSLLSQVLTPITGVNNWRCTGITVQQRSQTCGLSKGRTGNRGDSNDMRGVRHFQFAWPTGSPDLTTDFKPVLGAAWNHDQADVWFEETDSASATLALGPLKCRAIKLAWGARMPVDQSLPLRGAAMGSACKLLSFGPSMVRIQDPWRMPGSYNCVEWTALPTCLMQNTEQWQRDRLMALGFADPDSGLVSTLPQSAPRGAQLTASGHLASGHVPSDVVEAYSSVGTGAVSGASGGARASGAISGASSGASASGGGGGARASPSSGAVTPDDWEELL
jgi:site-specific DNA-cytosine methylase